MFLLYIFFYYLCLNKYNQKIMTYNHIKSAKIENDPTKHYPNKNESALLRRIMAKTGLIEEEIRNIKKYRKMLADASKSSKKSLKSASKKYYKKCIKYACKETGLVPQHPKTLEALEKILDKKNTHYLPWYLYYCKETANSIVKKYAKK